MWNSRKKTAWCVSELQLPTTPNSLQITTGHSTGRPRAGVVTELIHAKSQLLPQRRQCIHPQPFPASLVVPEHSAQYKNISLALWVLLKCKWRDRTCRLLSEAAKSNLIRLYNTPCKFITAADFSISDRLLQIVVLLLQSSLPPLGRCFSLSFFLSYYFCPFSKDEYKKTVWILLQLVRKARGEQFTQAI